MQGDVRTASPSLRTCKAERELKGTQIQRLSSQRRSIHPGSLDLLSPCSVLSVSHLCDFEARLTFLGSIVSCGKSVRGHISSRGGRYAKFGRDVYIMRKRFEGEGVTHDKRIPYEMLVRLASQTGLLDTQSCILVDRLRYKSSLASVTVFLALCLA